MSHHLCECKECLVSDYPVVFYGSIVLSKKANVTHRPLVCVFCAKIGTGQPLLYEEALVYTCADCEIYAVRRNAHRSVSFADDQDPSKIEVRTCEECRGPVDFLPASNTMLMCPRCSLDPKKRSASKSTKTPPTR